MWPHRRALAEVFSVSAEQVKVSVRLAPLLLRRVLNEGVNEAHAGTVVIEFVISSEELVEATALAKIADVEASHPSGPDTLALTRSYGLKQPLHPLLDGG